MIDDRSLDKTIFMLQIELAATPSSQELTGMDWSQPMSGMNQQKKKKDLIVMGIKTKFSSGKRRDTVRETWILKVRSSNKEK